MGSWLEMSFHSPAALQEGFEAGSLICHQRESHLSPVPQFRWRESLKSACPTRPQQRVSLEEAGTANRGSYSSVSFAGRRFQDFEWRGETWRNPFVNLVSTTHSYFQGS